MLSVVIPAYNEGKLVLTAAQPIGKILKEAHIPHELVFVDDGSRDNTWDCLQAAVKEDSTVRAISFSRNFGKEAAVFAGLEYAKGDCVAVIDCDLQHPPEKLVDMYQLWEEGWEVINGVKVSRGKESAAHGFAAKCFYKLMSGAVKIDMSRASDFKLMDRKVVGTLLGLTEHKTFFRALVGWVGFKTTEVEFSVAERAGGATHWSTLSLIRYAVSNITSYSSAPMQIVTVLGFVTLALAVILGIQTLVNWAMGTAADGFTTVILLLLFIGSILMISLGIIGYYISQIFIEVKDRPRYLVARTCARSEGKDALEEKA